MSSLYTDGNRVVFVDSECRFIYEVMVYVSFKNITSMIKSKLYISVVEIPKIIETYFVNKYINICCSLYSAPKEWLINNNFFLYESPKEIKKKLKLLKNDEQKGNPSESRSGSTVSKTTCTRVKKS